MKPIVSRADLMRILAAVGTEGLNAAARGHGYEKEPPPLPEPKAPAAPVAAPTETRDAVSSEIPLGPIPFWQPRTIVFHSEEETETRVLQAAEAAEAAEVAGAWRGGDGEAPSSPLLSPWRRLGPLLQSALTVDRCGRRVDLPRLVRRLAEGRQIPRLPRLRRRGWVPVEVIVDRPLRLAPFWSDQAAVVQELERVLGREAVTVHRLANGPESEPDEQIWQRSRGHASVLALTDLGWYAGEDERSAWQRMSRRLQAAGRRPVALAPVPRSRWTPELASAWRAIPWERPAPGSAPDDATTRAARVERLLVLLAPTMRIERGLLRTIRWIVPRVEADVGVEADLWAARVLGDMFPRYRVIEAAAVAGLRRRFVADVPVEDKKRVIAALRAWHWHRDLLPEAWHLEVLGLEKTLGSPAAREAGIAANESERAEAFMGWLFQDLERDGDDEETAETLRRWCSFIREQAPRALWDPSTRAGEALQKIAFRVGVVDVPNADPRLQALVSDEPPPKPREVLMWQVTDAVMAGQDAPLDNGSPLAIIAAARPSVTLASAILPEDTLDLSRPGERLAAPPRGPIELRTDRSTLRLEPLTRPAWARAIGRDRFGLWAELFFKGVPYRMRWIPPGRFIMGSPQDEPGRDDDENQHPVVITRGYWLGETPVTQALWQAVTGENPSHFQTPDRPVEQVSWDDCQLKLITRLIREFPSERGEGFRLPTEAEWEHACRAGTTTATYAGPIEILGANNAPMLDAIAWYGGNSGEKFDLRDGIDSSDWPDKQHPHSEAGTRRVRGKLPNQWGLYDMLGNVWEWCSDWLSRSDSSATQQDPTGPASGGYRVVRGGSWDDRARFVRAAYRNAADPGRRDSCLGLRLARGQGPAGAVGPEGPESGRDARRAGRGAPPAAHHARRA